MTNGAKYYLMKRCLKCFKVMEFNLTKCSQCNYLFVGEATETEKEKAYDKLIRMQKAKETEED